MPAPYSNDLRCKVIEACECGVDSVEEIAEYFGVSKRFVYRLKKRFQATQSIVPKEHGGGRLPAFSEEKCNELRYYLKHHTDATLEELKQASGVNCSLEMVSKTLKRMGITRKKNVACVGTRS